MNPCFSLIRPSVLPFVLWHLMTASRVHAAANFKRALSDSELGRISFYSKFASIFIGTGYQIKSGGFTNEVIPVPEPETWATAVLLLIGGGLWYGRKRKQEPAHE